MTEESSVAFGATERSSTPLQSRPVSVRCYLAATWFTRIALRRPGSPAALGQCGARLHGGMVPQLRAKAKTRRHDQLLTSDAADRPRVPLLVPVSTHREVTWVPSSFRNVPMASTCVVEDGLVAQ
jgi:hypothetical protein